jgi:hypothetical protein
MSTTGYPGRPARCAGAYYYEDGRRKRVQCNQLAADFVKRHEDGSTTTIENGTALCDRCSSMERDERAKRREAKDREQGSKKPQRGAL